MKNKKRPTSLSSRPVRVAVRTPFVRSGAGARPSPICEVCPHTRDILRCADAQNARRAPTTRLPPTKAPGTACILLTRILLCFGDLDTRCPNHTSLRDRPLCDPCSCTTRSLHFLQENMCAPINDSSSVLHGTVVWRSTSNRYTDPLLLPSCPPKKLI